MPRPRNSRLAGPLRALLPTLLLAACNAAPAADAPPEEKPAGAAPLARIGLMSSLPLVWPLGADVGAIAGGAAGVPWQREALEAAYVIEPLDTLSPIPALSPDAPDIDPLAGLARLAVIQPRGLSPADNVALDDWVRAGGRLLLVLDPALTGEYDLPLGDPRRPVDSAPIPPVVGRWGMGIGFDPDQAPGVIASRLGDAPLPLALTGRISLAPPGAAGRCTLLAEGAAARCRVGKGQVTLIADAAIFEHSELAGAGGLGLTALIDAALR